MISPSVRAEGENLTPYTSFADNPGPVPAGAVAALAIELQAKPPETKLRTWLVAVPKAPVVPIIMVRTLLVVYQ
jgi:hypothetical protein